MRLKLIKFNNNENNFKKIQKYLHLKKFEKIIKKYIVLITNYKL